MFQFSGSPHLYLLIQYRLTGYCPAGFPHSDICGSMLICSSPQLFAAYHVLLRLLMPRHSPCALLRLTFSSPAPLRFRFSSLRFHSALSLALLEQSLVLLSDFYVSKLLKYFFCFIPSYPLICFRISRVLSEKTWCILSNALLIHLFWYMRRILILSYLLTLLFIQLSSNIVILRLSAVTPRQRFTSALQPRNLDTNSLFPKNIEAVLRFLEPSPFQLPKSCMRLGFNHRWWLKSRQWKSLFNQRKFSLPWYRP